MESVRRERGPANGRQARAKRRAPEIHFVLHKLAIMTVYRDVEASQTHKSKNR